MDWGQEGGIYFMDFLQEYRVIESNSEAKNLMFVCLYYLSPTCLSLELSSKTIQLKGCLLAIRF